MFDPYVITNKINPVTICQVIHKLVIGKDEFPFSFTVYCEIRTISLSRTEKEKAKTTWIYSTQKTCVHAVLCRRHIQCNTSEAFTAKHWLLS